MARNKYPEKSRQKILDVSQALFMQNGYEKTTIQSIVDQLDGMTKGVIYHHFKSKKEIWLAVMERMASNEQQQEWYKGWPGKNGLEKLQISLLKSLEQFQRHDVAYSSKVMLKDYKMIGEMYFLNLDTNAKEIEGYVNEGVKDGSIKVQHPTELPEFIILTINIWIGIRFINLSRTEVVEKFRLLKEVYDGMNFPLINEEIIGRVAELYDHLNHK